MMPFMVSHTRLWPDTSKDLIFAWPMKYRNGVLADISGSGNDGDAYNSPMAQSNLLGDFFEFSNAGESYARAVIASTSIDSFTFAAWVKKTSASALTNRLLNANSGSTPLLDIVRKNSDNSLIISLAGATSYNETVLSDGWDHIGIRYQNGGGNVFVNGVKSVVAITDQGALGSITNINLCAKHSTSPLQWLDAQVIIPTLSGVYEEDDTWFAEQYAKGRTALWKTNPVNNTVATVVGGASKPFIGDSPFRAPSGQWDVVDDTVETENAKVIECISAGNLEFPQALLGEGIGEDDNWRGWIDTGAGYVEGAISTTSRILAMATGDKISIGALSGNYSVIKDLLA